MRAKSSCFVVAAAFLIGVVCGALSLAAVRHNPIGVVRAQGAPAAGGCTNATFDGAYGAQITGFRLAAPDGTALANPVPFNAVAVAAADGVGTIDGIEMMDNDGFIGQEAESGTYAVNTDCTFSITSVFVAPGGHSIMLHLSGVLVDGGKKGYLIDVEPGRPDVVVTIERQ